MYDDYEVLLDVDGVLIDSEERIVKRKEERKDLTWDEFFETVNWEELYYESEEINDSLQILRKLQEQRKGIYGLSKFHVPKEAQYKTKRLRKNGIYIPIFYCPPHVKKSEIWIPNQKSLLVDDSKKNITDWIENGGVGLLFDGDAENNSKEKVKSLHFLLRG